MSSDVKRLYRSRKNRWVGGVCGGLAEYFHIDAIVVRLIFIVLTLFLVVSIPVMLVLYVIMWIAIPAEPEPAAEVIETTAKE